MAKRTEYLVAARSRGWHFADSCHQLGKEPSQEKLDKMLKDALQEAKRQAEIHSETFDLQMATKAFWNGYNDSPRVV